MAENVKVKDLGWGNILRQLGELDHIDVLVGVQADAGADKEGVRNVDKAFWNEFGTENIPERSFLRSAFDENEEDLHTTVARLWDAVKAGRATADQVARILGQRHEDQVKMKIKDGPFKANSPLTVALKGSTKPLIDSGQMRQSIRYVVEK